MEENLDSPFQELIATKAIRIGPSSIPDAGLGVFATAPIPGQRAIGWYRGRVLSKRQLDNTYGRQVAPYVLQLGPNLFLDAADPRHSNFVRYVNDGPASGRPANVEFTPYGFLATLRDIRPGEELLASYGNPFWKST